MQWTFLVNCGDEFEAGMIIGILEAEGIQSQTQYRGAGGYIRVITGVGKDVDIYVPAGQYVRAKEILASLAEEIDPEE